MLYQSQIFCLAQLPTSASVRMLVQPGKFDFRGKLKLKNNKRKDHEFIINILIVICC